jgi:hypothetical protein
MLGMRVLGLLEWRVGVLLWVWRRLLSKAADSSLASVGACIHPLSCNQQLQKASVTLPSSDRRAMLVQTSC